MVPRQRLRGSTPGRRKQCFDYVGNRTCRGCRPRLTTARCIAVVRDIRKIVNLARLQTLDEIRLRLAVGSGRDEFDVVRRTTLDIDFRCELKINYREAALAKT